MANFSVYKDPIFDHVRSRITYNDESRLLYEYEVINSSGSNMTQGKVSLLDTRAGAVTANLPNPNEGGVATLKIVSLLYGRGDTGTVVTATGAAFNVTPASPTKFLLFINGQWQIISTSGGNSTSFYPTLQQGSKLVGIPNVGSPLQGSAVSLSADGNVLAVGCPGYNSNLGTVFVFVRSTGAPNTVAGSWSQQAQLSGAGNIGNGKTGFSVSLSSNGLVLAAGAPTDNTNVGAAYIWTSSNSGLNSTWTQVAKLIGTGGTVGSQSQGTSVSLNADATTLAVGAPTNNSSGGATYIYVLSAGTWTQQGASPLVGSGGTPPSTQGTSVSLSASGNTLAVGGPVDGTDTGAVWIFSRTGTTWSQQTGSPLVGTGSTGAAMQGTSVCLSASGDTLISGGPADNTNIGAVWFFTRINRSWSQYGLKSTASDETGAGLFGSSVALSSDGCTAIIGGPGDASGVGASWVFVLPGNNWSQEGSKLIGSGATGMASQGTSVAIDSSGDTIASGGSTDSSSKGATWIFV